jgi:hypothetical protein
MRKSCRSRRRRNLEGTDFTKRLSENRLNLFHETFEVTFGSFSVSGGCALDDIQFGQDHCEPLICGHNVTV